MDNDRDPFANLFMRAAPEPLAAEERSRMRATLSEYSAFRPIPSRPRAQRVAVARALFPSGRAAVASAIVACCIFVSTGIAFASEGTVPGDLLYGVKVGVVEPIQTALMFSPQAQTAWQQTLAVRRLKEATTLASEGALTKTTEERLAVRFSRSAQQAAVGAKTQHAQDPGEAAVLATAFSARLAGYQDVFEGLRNRAGASTKALVAAIEARNSNAGSENLAEVGIMPVNPNAAARGTVAGSMHPLEAAPIASASAMGTSAAAESTSTVRIAERMHTAAAEALQTSMNVIALVESSVGSTTAAQARAQLDTARAAVQQGEALLVHHDATSASRAFTVALSISTRIEVLVRAAQSLKIDPFTDATTSERTANPHASTSPATGPSVPSSESTTATGIASSTPHGKSAALPPAHGQPNPPAIQGRLPGDLESPFGL